MNKPLTLTLHTDPDDHKKTRTYSQDFVPLNLAIEAATMREPFEDATKFDSVEWIKAHVKFVAKVFGITEKEIFDGVDARDLDQVIAIVNTILGINPN